MSIKKVFGQMDENGLIRVAFVGSDEELQAQIDKDYAEVVAKIEQAIKKYEEELAKLKGVDLTNLTAENIEDAAKLVHYTKMLLKTKKELGEFKKPTIQDGTYFLLDYVGKAPQLEEK